MVSMTIFDPCLGPVPLTDRHDDCGQQERPEHPFRAGAAEAYGKVPRRRSCAAPGVVSLFWATWLILAAAPLQADAAERRPPARGNVLEQARLASVEILRDGHLSGSGAFLAGDGLAITAAHVVGAPGGRIELLSPVVGRIGAKVIAVDYGHDLALLEASTRDGGYPGLRLASAVPAAATSVLLFGAPLYRHQMLVPGIIARQESTFEYLGTEPRYVEVVAVAATVPQGMSGGPWINGQGELIGVQSLNMAVNGSPLGITFMAPVNAVRQLVDSKKTVQTASLGAGLNEVWERDAKFLSRLPQNVEGTVVPRVRPQGPAERAGLQPEDTIVAIDGQAVRYRDQILRAVRQKKPGQTVELTVLPPDGAGSKQVSVVLGCLEVAWLKQ